MKCQSCRAPLERRNGQTYCNNMACKDYGRVLKFKGVAGVAGVTGEKSIHDKDAVPCHD